MFQIVYCFTNSKGLIETNDYGEVIYTAIVDAKNCGEALDKLCKKEKFIQVPEILEIKEIKNENFRIV